MYLYGVDGDGVKHYMRPVMGKNAAGYTEKVDTTSPYSFYTTTDIGNASQYVVKTADCDSANETEYLLQYYDAYSNKDFLLYLRDVGAGPGSVDKEAHTNPYSLYTDTDKAKATCVDVIEESTGNYSLAYPYNSNTARIYVYDVGNNSSIDTGVNTGNVPANHHFQWDAENAWLYQTESDGKYVLAVKELENSNTGTKQIWMQAVPESNLSTTVVPVRLEAHLTHTVDNWVIETPATTSATGIKTGTCTVCGRKLQEEIPILTPAFSGNAISLSDAFSLHFYVEQAIFADGVYTNPRVTFTVEGTETTVSDYTEDEDSYIFTYDDITPNQMSEQVTMQVYRNDVAVSTDMRYSMESYAHSWLTRSNASDAQKQLVTAMIRYGDAAKAYAERTYDLQNENDVLYLGRVYEMNDTQWFNWSASGFKVQFQGSGLQAKIASNAPNATNYAYLKVYVDGVEQDDILLDEKMQTVPLATGLDPEKTHTVEVRKRNSPRSSTAGLVNLELTDGAKLDKPAAKTRLIEFVGDSLTVGWSAALEEKPETTTAWSTATEDGTKTYSKQVADAFGAEYMVTAISGRGVVMNNSNAGAPWFPDIYPELDIYNIPGTAYDFALQPDVIVINLGTNDATNADLDIGVFQTGVVDFINLVRQKNPNAKIIWAYGLRSDNRTADVDAAIQAAVAQVNADGDTNVHYLALDLVPSTQTDLNHPLAEGYTASGEKLIEKITEITGWQ